MCSCTENIHRVLELLRRGAFLLSVPDLFASGLFRLGVAWAVSQAQGHQQEHQGYIKMLHVAYSYVGTIFRHNKLLA